MIRFENAKHFLHIESYARVTAIPYGVRRLNGSSKLLPYHRFVRKVIAIPYGVRRTFSDDQWSPLQW